MTTDCLGTCDCHRIPHQSLQLQPLKSTAEATSNHSSSCGAIKVSTATITARQQQHPQLHQNQWRKIISNISHIYLYFMCNQQQQQQQSDPVTKQYISLQECVTRQHRNTRLQVHFIHNCQQQRRKIKDSKRQNQ